MGWKYTIIGAGLSGLIAFIFKWGSLHYSWKFSITFIIFVLIGIYLDKKANGGKKK
jgi:hypothetical protein